MHVSQDVIDRLLEGIEEREDVTDVPETIYTRENMLEFSLHDEKLWFVKCNRRDAERQLGDKAVGTFLIRPSSKPNSPYALSIV